MGLENPLHILIVLAVVLLVFGAKRLPDIGQGLGRGMREFKDGITGQDTKAAPSLPASDVPAEPR